MADQYIDDYLEGQLDGVKAKAKKKGGDGEVGDKEMSGGDEKRRKAEDSGGEDGDSSGDRRKRRRDKERRRSASRSQSRHRSASRSRSRSPSRSHRDRNRDLDRDRDHDRRRYRRSHDDSHDRSRRRRDDNNDRGHRKTREKDWDRDRRRGRDRDARSDWHQDRKHRNRSRSVSRSPSESPEKPKPKTAEEREAEAKQAAIDELTRDQRTVFVNQLTQKVKEKDLKRFFGTCGKVKNVIMLRDKFTNRHRGFAYVEMKDLDAVPLCLQFNAVAPDFQKFPVLVKASEAEKNFLAREEKAAAAGTRKDDDEAQSTGVAAAADQVPGIVSRPFSGQSVLPDFSGRRLQVGNVHPNVTEKDLQTIVSQFGSVESVDLSQGQLSTAGTAIVVFKERSGASLCLERLNGLDIAGKALTVGMASATAESAPAPYGGALPGNYTSGGGANPAQVNPVGSGAASGNWKLDDDTGSGVALNSGSRAALMAKLAQGAGISIPEVAMVPSPANVVMSQPISAAPGGPSPIEGALSFCILIKNMYNAEEETDEGWELDIKEDVEAECSRHGGEGSVLHSFVDAANPGGLVYVLFTTTASAEGAARALHGRWFAQRMITVVYLTPDVYVRKFPEVKSILTNCR